MMRAVLLLIVLSAFTMDMARGQETISAERNRRAVFFQQANQKFYLGLRLPQSFFTKSDLHLFGYANDPIAEKRVDVDVTIKDLVGKDDGFIYPAFFGAFIKGLAAPPMEIAFGYKLKNSSWGIGGRWIHYKYTMVPGQQRPVSGHIDNVEFDGSVQTFSFLTDYEHTDGHNMICIGPEFHRTVVQSKNGQYALDFSTYLAPAMSLPRTQASITLPSGAVMGRNNHYKVSGGGMLGEISVMASLWRYLGINLYANYSSIWYKGATILEEELGDLRAKHFIGAFTYGTALFVQVPMKSREERRAKRIGE